MAGNQHLPHGYYYYQPDPTRPYFQLAPTTFETPEVCPCGDVCKSFFGMESMCDDCGKPHRFDDKRDLRYSTFTCQWCGDHVVHMERDIKEHLQCCSHRPHPQIYLESEMCDCWQGNNCSCGLTPYFFHTHTMYYEELQPREVEGETIHMSNFEDNMTEEMMVWNENRLGYPPKAQPMIVRANNSTENRLPLLKRKGGP